MPEGEAMGEGASCQGTLPHNHCGPGYLRDSVCRCAWPPLTGLESTPNLPQHRKGVGNGGGCLLPVNFTSQSQRARLPVQQSLQACLTSSDVPQTTPNFSTTCEGEAMAEGARCQGTLPHNPCSPGYLQGCLKACLADMPRTTPNFITTRVGGRQRVRAPVAVELSHRTLLTWQSAHCHLPSQLVLCSFLFPCKKILNFFCFSCHLQVTLAAGPQAVKPLHFFASHHAKNFKVSLTNVDTSSSF